MGEIKDIGDNRVLPILYMVIPCYNEEAVIDETTTRLKEKYTNLIDNKTISDKSRILYVNDGSKDNTWNKIREIVGNNEIFAGLNLAKNAGHQNAVLAGLMTVTNKCDIAITMDADLQDDINAIDEMIDKYVNEQCEVVYGVRSERKTDTKFKKLTAEGFYKFMQMMGADIVYNHADFRLMSNKILIELANYKEVNLFLRGMIPLIGFKSDKVYYERAERFAGESKYPLKKMLAFAINGITSFSVKPLKMITTLGIGASLISLVFLIWTIINKILGNTVDGWSSILCSIWFIGGLQLISLGVVGEYIGKIYSEVKQRPRYTIDKIIGDIEKE